jgi:phage terminase large subunit-like protein
MGEAALAYEPTLHEPQAGAQTIFATTSAEIAWFGGTPGTGKSLCLLYEGAKLTFLDYVRGLRCVFFRRQEVDLLKGGGLWDASEGMFPAFGGRSRRDTLEWIFEASSGAIEHRHRIELRHLHQERDRFNFDGSQYDLIGFDELQQFTSAQFFYFLSRLRSVSGLRPRIRASLNPLPDSWQADLLEQAGYLAEDGYIKREMSGVIRWFIRHDDDSIRWFATAEEALAFDPGSDPISFTFVLATLEDNPAITSKDPRYRGRLANMTKADRMRLLGERDAEGRDRGGNWKDHTESGGFFHRDHFILCDSPPSPIVCTVRGWDRGASAPTKDHRNPDFTEGARLNRCDGGEIYIDDLVFDQLDPVETTDFVLRTARGDGTSVTQAIFQDTGGAGKTDAITIARVLDGFDVQIISSEGADQLEPKPKAGASRAKRALAKPWASLVRQRRVYLKRAAWNARLLGQAHRFPMPGTKDDGIDAVSCGFAALDLGGISLGEAMKGWIGR